MTDDLNAITSDAPDETPPYRVKLEVFEGPLDLLLSLIEKQELDITKVSLVAVTDQYLDYIQRLDRITADNLADFLVVAAKLLLIKSRALLPGPPPLEEGEEEEDVGEELARQLREYKRLKALAGALRDREEQGLQAFVRVASLPDVERELDLTDVTLDDLVAAVREALTIQPPAEHVNGVLPPIAISVEEKIQEIRSLLSSRRSFSFTRMLHSAASRIEVIVAFLALLQLIKQSAVQVRQARLFGEILVSTVPLPTADQPPQE